jgi:hypothetical protein
VEPNEALDPEQPVRPSLAACFLAFRGPSSHGILRMRSCVVQYLHYAKDTHVDEIRCRIKATCYVYSEGGDDESIANEDDCAARDPPGVWV